MEHKESLVSAHHNYLLNNMLTPGFVLGDPDSQEGFYFVADFVPRSKTAPCISARLFNRQGLFLLEMESNGITQNPGHCSSAPTPGGFRVLYPTGDILFEVNTQKFANGYLTRIQGTLYDSEGRLRMEPSSGGNRVHGKTRLVLRTSFQHSQK
jgi:hypothetical protein